MNDISPEPNELAVSVVVPVYNEEQNVGPLLHEIHAALREREQSYEIVVVDDGSSDETSARAEQAGGARVLRHPHNRGQSAAVLTGIWHAKGRVIVTIDGDGQNDPADIPALLEALAKPGVDAAQGVRVSREDRWSRRLASRTAFRIRSGLLKDGIRDTGCALRAFPREDALRLPQFDGVHRLLSVVLSFQGLAIAQVPTHHRPRCAGVSSYDNVGRGLRGVFDLLGLLWLRRRLLPTRGDPRHSEPAPRLALEAIAILLMALLPALVARSLWSSDELRYVEVARELAETGDWVTLHLNGLVRRRTARPYRVQLGGLWSPRFATGRARLFRLRMAPGSHALSHGKRGGLSGAGLRDLGLRARSWSGGPNRSTGLGGVDVFRRRIRPGRRARGIMALALERARNLGPQRDQLGEGTGRTNRSDAWDLDLGAGTWRTSRGAMGGTRAGCLPCGGADAALGVGNGRPRGRVDMGGHGRWTNRL